MNERPESVAARDIAASQASGEYFRAVDENSLWTRFANNQKILAYVLLLPSILVLCFVVIYPFFSAVSISLYDKYIGAPATFVGLGNYIELFEDRTFKKVVWNTFVYTSCAVAIKFMLGLAMALVLSRPRRFNNIYRTILFIPWAVPTLVAALNFRWIFDDFSGMLNNILLAWFGVNDVISWLGDPNLAMGSVVAVAIWAGTPFYTMSFLAGLQAIPKELYEAARIDGANGWQEFWHVTIPQMRNVFTIVVMLSTIWTSTNLVIVQVLTNGGPANTTQILPNLSYNYALFAGRLGIGSAVNMIFFPILAIFVFLISRRMLAERV